MHAYIFLFATWLFLKFSGHCGCVTSKLWSLFICYGSFLVFLFWFCLFFFFLQQLWKILRPCTSRDRAFSDLLWFHDDSSICRCLASVLSFSRSSRHWIVPKQTEEEQQEWVVPLRRVPGTRGLPRLSFSRRLDCLAPKTLPRFCSSLFFH